MPRGMGADRGAPGRRAEARGGGETHRKRSYEETLNTTTGYMKGMTTIAGSLPPYSTTWNMVHASAAAATIITDACSKNVSPDSGACAAAALRRRRRRRGRRSARLVPSAMAKRADAKPASGARSRVMPGGEGSESPEGRVGQVYSYRQQWGIALYLV